MPLPPEHPPICATLYLILNTLASPLTFNPIFNHFYFPFNSFIKPRNAPKYLGRGLYHEYILVVSWLKYEATYKSIIDYNSCGADITSMPS